MTDPNETISPSQARRATPQRLTEVHAAVKARRAEAASAHPVKSFLTTAAMKVIGLAGLWWGKPIVDSGLKADSKTQLVAGGLIVAFSVYCLMPSLVTSFFAFAVGLWRKQKGTE